MNPDLPKTTPIAKFARRAALQARVGTGLRRAD
jgi:hypothetical protein